MYHEVITLTSEQMMDAANVAKQLHDRLRKKGCKDAHGLRKSDATAEMEAGGAQAELAAALMLGVEWSARNSCDTNGPDIGQRTQVRSSSKERSSHSLIVRSRDLEKYGNVPFVLIIQQGAKFRILGWMMAFEATQKGRLWDGNNDRPQAWFVSQDYLHNTQLLRIV